MWLKSHLGVDNDCIAGKLFTPVLYGNKSRLNHTSKFAQVGDMWKNHINQRFY